MSYLTTLSVTIRGRGINFGHEPLVEDHILGRKPVVCSTYIVTWQLEKDYCVISFR